MKYISIFAVAVFLAGCLVTNNNSVEDSNPLTSPPAPFKQKTKGEVKAQIFKPEIVGNSIVSGNKRVEIKKNGRIFLSENGKILTEGYLLFFMKNKSAKKNDWFKIGDSKHFRGKDARIRKKGNKFLYEAEIIYDGAKGKCQQTIQLLENGLIKIDADATFSANTKVEMGLSSYWFSFNYGQTLNKKIRYKNKDYTINKRQNWDSFFFKRPKSSIDFFYNTPRESFSILPEVCESTRFYLTDWSGKKYNFRLFPKWKTSHVSFFIDIRKALQAESGKTCGGIDFKAIEDLEMPDFDATKNFIKNPSFERGFNCYWKGFSGVYKGPEVWHDNPYNIENKSAVHGEKCLRLKTRVKNKRDYRAMGWRLNCFPTPLEPAKYTFSFYAKGQLGKNQRLSVWFPNSAWVGYGNKHLPIGFNKVDRNKKAARKVFKLSPKWKRYSMTFDVPESMPVFANIGADSKDGKSYVWLDSLQLEKGNKVTEFVPPIAEGTLLTSRKDNFLSPEDKVDAKLEISAKPNSEGKVKVSVSDFFSKKLFEENFNFKCGKNGKAVVSLPFEGIFPQGIFMVKAEYELENGEKTYDFHRFSIMDFLENKHRLKNIFSVSYGDIGGNTNFLKVLERWRKIGIGAINHMQNWDKKAWDAYRDYGVEPTDAFMISYIRPYLSGASKLLGFALRNPPHAGYGMKPNDPLIIMRDYHFDGNGEPTPEYLEKFKNAAAKIAKENPWINTWAFGGEVFAKFNPSWWAKDGSRKNGFKNFAKILKAFCQGVKKGNPHAMVFQDDPCNMLPAQGIAETKELLSTTNELGGFKFDLIGIHPYRKTPESPDLDADAQVLFNMLKDKGYENTPVFWPEGMHYGPYAIPQWGIESARWLPPGCWYYGTLSYDMGWTEKISAAWCARSWLVALKYQDRVKSFCSGQKVNNFIMDLNLTPYASQKISNTLGHLLGDAYFKKDIRFAPYVRTYIFEDSKKRPVAAVWCHHPKVDAGTISAPMAEADFDESLEQVFDLMEVERSFKIGKNGKVSFPISSFPLFLRGEPGSLDKFVKAFENASLISGEGVTPLMLEGKPNSPETIQIKAKNYLSRQFDGTLKVGDEKLALKVPASGTSSVTAKLPLPLSVAKIERENLNIAISSGEKSFSFDLSFRSFVSPKTDSVISIDGKLDDWKNIPAIKFINRYTGRKKKNIKDEDFSGWFKTTWNEKGIYICVEIKDDKFVHKAFAETGKRWSNDCLQIYFDTLCDARSSQQRGYDENDYDYAIFPNSKGDGSVVYRYRTPDPQLGLATQAPRDKTIAEDIPSAFKKTDNGYVYEVFFPAKYLLPIRLEKGYAFGFGLFAADCDDNKAEYSGRVKSALTLAPEGKGCYNKPHLWPVMLLWK